MHAAVGPAHRINAFFASRRGECHEPEAADPEVCRSPPGGRATRRRCPARDHRRPHRPGEGRGPEGRRLSLPTGSWDGRPGRRSHRPTTAKPLTRSRLRARRARAGRGQRHPADVRRKRGTHAERSTMGLVYRNGRPYLYRSVRRGGRVTSEYLASGDGRPAHRRPGSRRAGRATMRPGADTERAEGSSTTWSEPSTRWPSKPETSPAKP